MELTDNQDRPKLGYFKLRFVNLINSKDKYDLYFVYPGFSFFGYDPIVENFGFGKTTAYYDAETATAEVFVTEAGTDNVVYDSGLLDFEDRSVSTFLLLENPGGGEPFEGLFLEDR